MSDSKKTVPVSSGVTECINYEAIVNVRMLMKIDKSFHLWALVLMGLFGCACHAATESSGSEMDTGTNVLPEQKVLESGQILRRNAGSEWSRNKIRKYLNNNEISLSNRPSSGGAKCKTFQSDIQNLKFDFIEPDVISDDWNDPQLDYYREKFRDFRYGLGYLENYGPENPMIPTWNINVYQVDTNSDGIDEAVL